MDSAAEDGWSCHKCTFINSDYRKKCEMCFSSRSSTESSLPRTDWSLVDRPSNGSGSWYKGRSPLHKLEGDKTENSRGLYNPEWTCTRCTLVNRDSTRRCLVCNSRPDHLAASIGIERSKTEPCFDYEKRELAAEPSGRDALTRPPSRSSKTYSFKREMSHDSMDMSAMANSLDIE